MHAYVNVYKINKKNDARGERGTEKYVVAEASHVARVINAKLDN